MVSNDTSHRMTQRTLRLDDFLPYRLSIASNLVSDVIARAYGALFALTVPEWRLIAVMAESDGITQQQLCLRTRMDKVTVSRAAIALAGRGLIRREAHPQDGRSQLLTLSEEGAELYRNVAPKALELEARIFGQLDPADLTLLRDMLDRISRAAERLVD